MFFGKDCGNAMVAVKIYVSTSLATRIIESKSSPGSSDARPLKKLEFLFSDGRFIAFNSDLDH
jgi:hypothetical protein